MKKRKVRLGLLFCVIIFVYAGKAQVKESQLLKVFAPDTILHPSTMAKDTTVRRTLPAFLPVNFYSTHLGAACKLEWQMEKQTRIPLRFRLGSKDQVDYLEGKGVRH